ncbi:MAG TPA: PEP-utilizing enzyme, partial [Methylomirabilota bacterium]|nr:PEP-utilizing enzyme [Methylomirabilota bacterium]
LAAPADVFFTAWDELPRVLTEPGLGWGERATERRRERERNAELEAPDLVSSDGTEGGIEIPPQPEETELIGYGVSPGVVIGRVRVLQSIEGIGYLSGEIVVFPAIEPTLTPIFPLVRGVIAEMGGLLSHAAILAREYGLPAVVSVRDATRRLRDGDWIELDGASGRIRLLERAG